MSFETKEFVEIEEFEDEGRKLIFKLSPTTGLHVCGQELYEDEEADMAYPKEKLFFEYAKNSKFILNMKSSGNTLSCSKMYSDYSEVGIEDFPDNFEIINFDWAEKLSNN